MKTLYSSRTFLEDGLIHYDRLVHRMIDEVPDGLVMEHEEKAMSVLESVIEELSADSLVKEYHDAHASLASFTTSTTPTKLSSSSVTSQKSLSTLASETLRKLTDSINSALGGLGRESMSEETVSTVSTRESSRVLRRRRCTGS